MAEIKLSSIKKENNKYEETDKFYLNEKDFITYYPNFSYDKIQNVLKDLILFGAHAHKINDNTLNDPLKLDIFLNFLIIKHFTSLHKELKNKPYETHIATMMEMLNVGWYQLILSAFNPEEVSKVLESAYKSIGTLKELSERKEFENITENTTVN